ncbi:TatD family hydrolase [Paenibacillus sp. FSL R7-0198]|uniref:amidohydrolase family protein n=1 Tax=Paenibacillus TaxID=44249 RepID=UPI0011A98933|nr:MULTISPECIES: TatD family hydrolase [Paenibacillus]MDQ0660936.1 putative TIM-barrel fold metal-dependent hydrolase [Paenibacillus sp. W2I17]
MPIIDIHIHLSDIDSFHRTAIDLSKVDYSAAGLKAEFDKNDVILGIGMGVTEQTKGAFPDSSSPNPMGLDLEEKVPSFLMECVGINPNALDGKHAQDELDRIEARLQSPEVAGIKLYAGYYHHYVYDKIYTPVYELAAKYNLPVVIHTGDTYSMNGLLKYSHPLTVDELALQQRGVNFMICHLGDPWVMDAAEVVAKNPNVYADLSGLVVGDRPHFERFMNEPLFMDHFRRALVYSDHYEKMLFGTDWPLAPIDLYAEFVRRLVPEQHHDKVFYENAFGLFPRIGQRIADLG